MFGYFVLVLHTHLPYVVGHGRWPHGMDWLNEAASECYIPLLNVFNELRNEGVNFKVTINISPILAEQLASREFAEEFLQYLDMRINLAEEDEVEFKRTGRKNLAKVAKFWKEFYSEIKRNFIDTYHTDLLSAFRSLQDSGHIEIITCAATHAYLPLLALDTSVQAQIKLAVKTHEKYFGKKPEGIWLPECAYRPAYRWKIPVELEQNLTPTEYERKGIEEFLSENGLKFFFVDTATLRGGKTIGIYIERFEGLRRLWEQFESQVKYRPEEEKSPYEIYLVGSGKPEKKPVAVLTRDPKTGLQVWSGEWGYPGDAWYLDFHKKKFPSGLRYWRVTNPKADLADKLEYEIEKVEERLEENSSHFVDLITATLKEHFDKTGKPGVLTAPYDTELFGHWWFEGPGFLKKVFQKLNNSKLVKPATASESIENLTPTTVVSLPEGSWGEGGYHYIWLNKDTEWTWRHIYPDEFKMRELAKKFHNLNDEKLIFMLKQLARELVLLQSSDWQFLISTISARDYAEMRVSLHHENFTRIAEIIERYASTGELKFEDWNFVVECAQRDKVFDEIDIKWWAEVEFP
jgi:1,4-alpha-glucan branching enzyme